MKASQAADRDNAGRVDRGAIAYKIIRRTVVVLTAGWTGICLLLSINLGVPGIAEGWLRPPSHLETTPVS